MRSITVAFVAVALGAVPLAFARSSTPVALQASTPQQPRTTPPQDANDPTRVDADLQRALNPHAPAATPYAPPVEPLPTLALRGLVVAAGGTGAAMIEVGDALYHVEPESTIRAQGPNGGVHTLRVRSIDANEVTLESVHSGETIVLR